MRHIVDIFRSYLMQKFLVICLVQEIITPGRFHHQAAEACSLLFRLDTGIDGLDAVAVLLAEGLQQCADQRDLGRVLDLDIGGAIAGMGNDTLLSIPPSYIRFLRPVTRP